MVDFVDCQKKIKIKTKQDEIVQENTYQTQL